MFKFIPQNSLKIKGNTMTMIIKYNLRNFYFREDHHKKHEVLTLYLTYSPKSLRKGS